MHHENNRACKNDCVPKRRILFIFCMRSGWKFLYEVRSDWKLLYEMHSQNETKIHKIQTSIVSLFVVILD